jgi:hypothetical protein
VRDDLGRLADLLRRTPQVLEHALLIETSKVDQIDHVANQQTNVVQRVVQLVGNASRELAQGGQLASLHKLRLFFTKLALAALDLERGCPQVTHDVDHRFATLLESLIRAVGLLQDVQEGAPGMVEPLGLPGKAPPILLVVVQDVEHGFALVSQALVGRVHVGHDV